MSKMLDEILKLSVEERHKLANAIWASIENEGGDTEYSEAQRMLIQSRVESFHENPDNLVTWEQIKANLKK